MAAPYDPQALDAGSVKRFIDESSELSADEYRRRLDVTIVIHAFLCQTFSARYPAEYADWLKHDPEEQLKED
jgi:hypothetical protein